VGRQDHGREEGKSREAAGRRNCHGREQVKFSF
jgi:hypothetical protein